MAKSDSNNESSADFAKHAQQDEALRQAKAGGENESAPKPGLSWTSRFTVFVIFPSTFGTIGLYMGYLESLRKPDRKISFDQDFVMPFLLALAMAGVLFFQTGGFSTSEVTPLVAWPKARRIKKIIKKTKAEVEADKVGYNSTSNKKDD